jgi:hypothetical protein
MPVTTTDIVERGDTRTLSVALTVVDVPTDPATLTLTVRTPAGVSTTYTYGASAIVRDSAGAFHYDLTFTESGAWTYEWRSTVPAQVQGGVIEVQPSPIDDVPVTLDAVALGAFRLELGDLGTDNQLFTDEQAQYFIDKRPTNLLLAVADAADALAARFAREFNFATTSEKRFDAGEKHEHYLKIAERLRDRATAEGDSGTATLTATDGQIVRVLRATACRVTTTFDANDVATNATGAVSVTVTREDGTAVRTGAALSTTVTGQYYFALTPTDTAQLDMLELVWTATIAGAEQTVTTYVEVRGARLFSIAQARRLRALDNTTAFPVSRLVEARTAAEIALERHLEVAFAPTYFRAVLDGRDHTDLMLPVTRPLTITVATVDGAAIDVDDLHLYSLGRVHRADGWTAGRANVVITGTHGYLVPPPGVSKACLALAREYLIGGDEMPDPGDVAACAALEDDYDMSPSYLIA